MSTPPGSPERKHSWGAVKLGQVFLLPSDNPKAPPTPARVVLESKRRVQIEKSTGHREWVQRNDERLKLRQRLDEETAAALCGMGGAGASARAVAASSGGSGASADVSAADPLLCTEAPLAQWPAHAMAGVGADGAQPPLVALKSGGIFKSAAVEVLRRERRLMTTGNITRRALELGLLPRMPGKTPDATMASALYTDIKKGAKAKGASTFVRPCEGHFGLREWEDDAELGVLVKDAGAPRGSVGGGSPTASGTARTRAVFGPGGGVAGGSSAEGARARPPTPPKDAAELRRRIADVTSAPGGGADAAGAPGSPGGAAALLPLHPLKRKAADSLAGPAAKAHRRAGAGIAMLLRAAAALDGGVAAPHAHVQAMQAMHAAHAHAAYAAMLAGAPQQQQPLTPPHAMSMGDASFGAQQGVSAATAALLAALRPHVEARAAAQQHAPPPAGFCAASLAAALQQSLDAAAAQANAQAVAQANAQAAAASTVAALLAALPQQAGGAHLELLRSLLGAAAHQPQAPPPQQQQHGSLLAALFAAQQQQPAAAM